jgi:hypothetical protein
MAVTIDTTRQAVNLAWDESALAATPSTCARKRNGDVSTRPGTPTTDLRRRHLPRGVTKAPAT